MGSRRMCDCLTDYKKIILFGGGCLAKRLYEQNRIIRERTIGVVDTVPPEKRSVKEFYGMTIVSPEQYENEIRSGAALVIAIGCIDVCHILQSFIEKYSYPTDNIIVVNPYQSLRFFLLNDEFVRETRIPFDDERYSQVTGLFKDDESKSILAALMNSKPFDGLQDDYELVRYNDIKDLFYYSEDYWQSGNFDFVKTDEATIFDCGAYIGDSIIDICNAVSASKKYYYAIEPLQENLKKILDNKDVQRYCTELIPLECGIGEHDEERLFGIDSNNPQNDGGRLISSQESDLYREVWRLQIRSIDTLNVDIRGQLYIKMDIEGAELEALKGASETIKKHHPFLAVCLYHRKNDLLEIPTYIESLGVEYEYYLRGGYHTILWAVPKL